MRPKKITTRDIIQYVLDDLSVDKRLKVQKEMQRSKEVRSVHAHYRHLIGQLKRDAQKSAMPGAVCDEPRLMLTLQQRIDSEQQPNVWAVFLRPGRYALAALAVFFIVISVLGVWRAPQKSAVALPRPEHSVITLRRPSLVDIHRPPMTAEPVFQIAHYRNAPDVNFSIPAQVSVSGIHFTKPSLGGIKQP